LDPLPFLTLTVLNQLRRFICCVVGSVCVVSIVKVHKVFGITTTEIPFLIDLATFFTLLFVRWCEGERKGEASAVE
jgi:hypothetical protein